MNKNLISITGKMYSGKDTVADMIKYFTTKEITHSFNHYVARNKVAPEYRPGYSPYEVKKFAGLLKKWVAEATGVKPEDLEYPEVKNESLGHEWSWLIEHEVNAQPKRYYLNRRMMLQKLGTEVGRSIHSNFWINALFIDWEECKKWIITDCRFPNEINAVMQRDGLKIRVQRPDLLRLGREDINPHISETALDDFYGFDEEIFNYDRLEDLFRNVKLICDKYEL